MRTGEGTTAPGGRALPGLLGISPHPPPPTPGVTGQPGRRGQVSVALRIAGGTHPTPTPCFPVLGRELGDWGPAGEDEGAGGCFPSWGGGRSMPADWVLPCSWQPIMQFINDQYEKYLQEEVNINRKKRIPDTRVHCCLYFIPATGHSYVPLARSGAGWARAAA